MKLSVRCILIGDSFSPKSVEFLGLSEVNELGDIGTKGRYRDRPTPYGSAVLKVETHGEDWSGLFRAIDLLVSNIDAISTAGATEVSISCRVESSDTIAFGISSEDMLRLAENGIDLSIDFAPFDQNSE